ncbi:MAG: flagellar protein FlgN [Lachnospiraceae bacterium]|jgi:flagellar biosynthesis/type III secretory pathway chaperone|nr:flagellar protein FlgN [Lachnospiraceae bacterium]
MNEFEKVIRNMIDLFGELVETEQQKLDAAAAHNVQVLEECVTKEQALQLRLRGLERSREKAQEQAGFGGLRFREIIDRLPRDEQEQLAPLFEALSRRIQMFQEINTDTNKILETNLHVLGKALDGDKKGVYGGAPKPRRITDRKA